ncbi:hypothetical protein I3500192B8_14850 [Acidaminococcus intestini]
MTQERLPSRRIDGISYAANNFVRCRRRGSNEEICFLTGLFDDVPKNKLRNGASTNIAVANKKYPHHGHKTPFYAKMYRITAGLRVSHVHVEKDKILQKTAQLSPL